MTHSEQTVPVLDVRTYKLKPGGGEEFDRLVRERALPMLQRFAIEVAGSGPSLEDPDLYCLMRAFPSAARREEQLASFYGSDEWTQNHRDAALALIATYHTIVIPLTPLIRERLPSDDTAVLTKLNLQFIDAFRQGSWELLEPILSASFSYLDGATGEVWTHERYVDNLRRNPSPALTIDQVTMHVDGNTAIVSARTSRQPGKYSRYVDTYERQDGAWVCIHACVWPLQPSD